MTDATFFLQRDFPSRCVVLALLLAGAACDDARQEQSPGAAALHPERQTASAESANFTSIQELLVDSQGYVYVLDVAPHLTVLSPDGRVARVIGRQGGGPGEFRRISSAEIGAGDTLFVFDPELSRLTAFEPGRSQPANVVHLREQYPYYPLEARRTAGGNLVTLYRRAYGGDTGRDQGRTLHDVVRLLGPDGALLRDSVLLLREQQFLDLSYASGGGATYQYPFGRRTIVRVAPDGRIYTAWTDSARVHVYSPEGEPIRTVEIRDRIEPRPITAAERDSLIDRYSPDGEHAPVLRRALDRLGHRTWPLLAEFILDDRGRIWYAPVPPRDATDNTWTALDERGSPVERLTLPVRASLRVIRGSRAYVTETDSLDVPRVVVYDIQSEATRRNE